MIMYPKNVQELGTMTIRAEAEENQNRSRAKTDRAGRLLLTMRQIFLLTASFFLLTRIGFFGVFCFVLFFFCYREMKVQANSPELALAPSRSQERGEARVDLLIGTMAMSM